MDEFIVAIFDTPSQAHVATQDLLAAGIAEGAMTSHDGTGATQTGTIGGQSVAPMRETHFRSNLFGAPDYDRAIYDRSLASGSTVLTVRTPENLVGEVIDILERHHPIDLDERAAAYGFAPPAPAEAQTIQLAEEELVVGKRQVSRGTTRVRRFTVETPVERQVTLRDVTVAVERRAVTDGRPAADGSFTEKVVEMTGTTEEPVVNKTSRVVEEVTVRGEISDRVETVRETVRREDVAVDKVEAPGSMPNASERTHRD